MTDISELEGRITAALDRIGQGLETLGPKPEASLEEQMTALKASLEDEKTANAQLQERVKSVKSKQKDKILNLTAEVERLRGEVDTGDASITRMRQVSSELRMNNKALREAVSAGVADPELINQSMMAELETLRAAQAADRAELDAILSELSPMIKSTKDADTTTNEESGNA